MRDGLAVYLDAIGRTSLLTATEERALAEAMAGGREAATRIANGTARPDDEAARLEGERAASALARANLRLVVSLAKRYPSHYRVDLADLIQAGNQGLLRAVAGFDGRKGFRFSTYATKWIRQSIGRMLDKSTAAAYLPIDTCFHLRAGLRSAAGDPAALPSELQHVERAYNSVSLDGLVGEGRSTLGDLLACGTDVEEVVLRRGKQGSVRQMVISLPEPERRAVELRFGLDGRPEHSYAEIACELDVTVGEVNALLGAAKRRLRSAARGAGLR